MSDEKTTVQAKRRESDIQRTNGVVEDSKQYAARIEQVKRLAGKFDAETIASKTYFTREDFSTLSANPRYKQWLQTVKEILNKMA